MTPHQAGLSSLDALREKLRAKLAEHPDWQAFLDAGTASTELAGSADFKAWLHLTQAADALHETNVDVGEPTQTAPSADLEPATGRAASRAPHLREITESQVTVVRTTAFESPVAPATSATAAGDEALGEPQGDDLTLVKGITRSLASRLADMGVTTFEQIAAWNRDDVRGFAEALGVGRRIARESWVEQAALLAAAPRPARKPPRALPLGAQLAPIPAPKAAPEVAVEPAAADREEATADLTAGLSDDSNGEGAAPEPSSGFVPNSEVAIHRQPHDEEPAGVLQSVAAPEPPEAAEPAAPAVPAAPEEPAASSGLTSQARIERRRNRPISLGFSPPPSQPRRSLMQELEGSRKAPAADILDIRGITPDLKRRLRGQGISTVEAIAELTPHDVHRLEAQLGSSARISKDNWIEQAAMLAGGTETAYMRLRATGATQALVPRPPKLPWLPRLRISELRAVLAAAHDREPSSEPEAPAAAVATETPAAEIAELPPSAMPETASETSAEPIAASNENEQAAPQSAETQPEPTPASPAGEPPADAVPQQRAADEEAAQSDLQPVAASPGPGETQPERERLSGSLAARIYRLQAELDLARASNDDEPDVAQVPERRSEQAEDVAETEPAPPAASSETASAANVEQPRTPPPLSAEPASEIGDDLDDEVFDFDATQLEAFDEEASVVIKPVGRPEPAKPESAAQQPPARANSAPAVDRRSDALTPRGIADRLKFMRAAPERDDPASLADSYLDEPEEASVQIISSGDRPKPEAAADSNPDDAANPQTASRRSYLRALTGE